MGAALVVDDAVVSEAAGSSVAVGVPHTARLSARTAAAVMRVARVTAPSPSVSEHVIDGDLVVVIRHVVT